MRITIESTDEFFEAEAVMVRLWRGTTESGAQAEALVAAVMVPEGEAPPAMKPIPPPVPSWSPALRDAMGRIWLLAGRLNDQEAIELLQFVSARASYRDDAWIGRSCEHCGQPYNGPAVYCSLQCAQADA